MKKYALNPNELSETILGIIFSVILLLVILVMSLMEKIDSVSALLIFFCMISIPIIFIIALVIRYIKKYSGCFCIQDNQLIIVKNRKKQVIEIEDIKFIELKHYYRNKMAKGSSIDNSVQFMIKLKKDNTYIPYIITNSILYEKLMPDNVRFFPDYVIETVKKDLQRRFSGKELKKVDDSKS